MPAAQSDTGKTKKILIAVALFLVAGVVFAWQSGMFDAPEKPNAEVQAAAAQKFEQAKAEAAKAPAPPSGAN
jgi:beta-lactam-binding protein with PASTA domain